MKGKRRGRPPGRPQPGPSGAPRSAPEFAEAERAFFSGRHGHCRELCAQMIRRNRRDAHAHRLLGMCCAETGRFEDAAASFETCVRLESRRPEPYLAMARLLVIQGRTAEAERWIEKSLRAAPDFEPARLEQAAVAERLGRLEEARAALQGTGSNAPQAARRAHLEATLALREGDPDEAVRLIGAHGESDAAEPMIRRRLLFLRGQAHDRMGDADAAMESWHAANRVMPAGFDAREFVAVIDEIIAFFTPERLRILPRAAERRESPVFVAGVPRSGTTLVEQILDVHPEAAGVGEPRELGRIASALPMTLHGGVVGEDAVYPKILVRLSTTAADALAEQYSAAVGAGLSSAVRRTIDKSLMNWRLLGLASLLFPGTRVIHTVRDPLDTGLSIYMNEFSVTESWTADLASIGLVLRHARRLMAHWRAVLGLPWLEVRYEDVVDDLDTWARRVVEHCGLPWDERCLRFHEHDRAVMTLSYAQVAQPIYRSAVGRARRYAAHLAPLRAALDG